MLKKYKILLYISIITAIIIIMFVSVEKDTGLKGLIFIPFLLLQIYIYRYHYSRPVTGNKSKLIAVMGLLMALSVLFQCSPVFYPGVGLIISPLSSLPVSLGSILFPQGATAIVIGSFILISFISMEEAMIFALATGAVGIAVSAVILSKKPILKVIWIPGLSLYCGILIITYIVGVPGMKDLFADKGILITALIVLLFSIIYSYLWILIVKVFLKAMMKIQNKDI
jgi:hypothetical protein